MRYCVYSTWEAANVKPARGAFALQSVKQKVAVLPMPDGLKQHLVDAFHCETGIDEPTSIGGRETLELGGSVRRSGFSSADNYADAVL